MARDTGPPSSGGRPLFLSPWSLLLGGVSVTFLGVVLSSALPVPLRLLCLGAGLLLGGIAVGQRLGSAGWDFEQRLESAGVLALAGLVALLADFGLDKDWDSAKLLLGVVTGVALAGSLLLLLPGALRRLTLSFVVLFHFAGMMVTITSVDPPGTQGPWLAKQLYVRLYQPYLEFLYLTNAYHFYSPNPGAPSQMWFAIRYSDDSREVLKVPHRDNSPVGMHYQRMLTLPEHVFTPMPRLPFTKAELAHHIPGVPGLAKESWEEIHERRLVGSRLPYSPRIPIVVDLDANFQYREPNDTSKRLIASCAKWVFRNAPPHGGAEVISVKVYRATHLILSPFEMARGDPQLDKVRFLPYFLGEFDGSGELLDRHEPFLYWYLPILKVSPEYPDGYKGPIYDRQGRAVVPPGVTGVRALVPQPKDGEVLDCVEIHARGYTPKPDKREGGKR